MSNVLFKLNTGATIPSLGFGTWQAAPGEVQKAVAHAIKVGYRHIDCAFCYANEDEVGQGIKDAIDSGFVKREDLFVTTKVWATFSSKVEEGLNLSLRSLGLDYVDLFLVHWPVAMNPNGNDIRFPKLPDGSRDIDHSWSHLSTWAQMEALPRNKARAIGVCNYSVRYLEELLAHAKTTPAVNQIENHPYLPQNDILAFCKERGILITAYSPLGGTGSPLTKDETVTAIARKHNKPEATVLLSMHKHRGSVVLAKSVTPSRIEQNLELIDLDTEDVEKLTALHKKTGTTRYVYPAFGIDFGFPDQQQK